MLQHYQGLGSFYGRLPNEPLRLNKLAGILDERIRGISPLDNAYRLAANIVSGDPDVSMTMETVAANAAMDYLKQKGHESKDYDPIKFDTDTFPVGPFLRLSDEDKERTMQILPPYTHVIDEVFHLNDAIGHLAEEAERLGYEMNKDTAELVQKIAYDQTSGFSLSSIPSRIRHPRLYSSGSKYRKQLNRDHPLEISETERLIAAERARQSFSTFAKVFGASYAIRVVSAIANYGAIPADAFLTPLLYGARYGIIELGKRGKLGLQKLSSQALSMYYLMASPEASIAFRALGRISPLIDRNFVKWWNNPERSENSRRLARNVLQPVYRKKISNSEVREVINTVLDDMPGFIQTTGIPYYPEAVDEMKEQLDFGLITVTDPREEMLKSYSNILPNTRSYAGLRNLFQVAPRMDGREISYGVPPDSITDHGVDMARLLNQALKSGEIDMGGWQYWGDYNKKDIPNILLQDWVEYFHPRIRFGEVPENPEQLAPYVAYGTPTIGLRRDIDYEMAHGYAMEELLAIYYWTIANMFLNGDLNQK
jgi:hypothetical protein